MKQHTFSINLTVEELVKLETLVDKIGLDKRTLTVEECIRKILLHEYPALTDELQLLHRQLELARRQARPQTKTETPSGQWTTKNEEEENIQRPTQARKSERISVEKGKPGKDTFDMRKAFRTFLFLFIPGWLAFAAFLVASSAYKSPTEIGTDQIEVDSSQYSKAVDAIGKHQKKLDDLMNRLNQIEFQQTSQRNDD